MKQVVFNSFPRSGNVYSSTVISRFIEGMFAAVHIPEIFQVKEIANVTIFRKPSDAISSLLNKQLENNLDIMPNLNFTVNEDQVIDKYNLYHKYMSYAIKYSDIIYIGKFDDLILNTVQHFENISKKFDIPLINNYKNNFNEMLFFGPTWEDKYDGHMPRIKDNRRLYIDQAVNSLPIIQELNKDYETFILQYQTKIN